MSGGTFHRCAACARLVIYGQRCTCGHDTNGDGDVAVTAPPAGFDPATWEAAVKVVGDRMVFHGDNANCTALGEDTVDECAGDVLRAALEVLGGNGRHWIEAPPEEESDIVW